MKGASADPCVSTINPPSNTRKTMIGSSHHFLRIFKNCQSSDMIDNLLILLPLKLSFG